MARVAAWTRMLADEGWDVRVLTAEPVPGRPLDPSLEADVASIEVVRLPARNVTARIAALIRPVKRMRGALKRTGAGAGTGGDGRSASPASSRIARWLAVPDDAVFWARRVPAMAARMLSQRPCDAIVASGPPYSALVAAVRVSERHGVPVLCDLRDPWRGNINLRWPTAFHARRSEALERFVMERASAVTAVSSVIAEEARALGAPLVEVVPNGFDPARVKPAAASPGPLRLAFLGRFSPAVFDPAHLFGAVRSAADTCGGDALTLDVYGPDADWIGDAVRASGADGLVTRHGFKPYAEAVAAVAGADVGVIVIADRPGSAGIYSGKLFDYLGIGVPVLLYGPPGGVAADVVREAGGVVVPYGDRDALAAALVSLAVRKAERGTLEMPTSPAVRARYDRRAQVARVSELVADAIGGRA